jgi:hypothetical protein
MERNLLVLAFDERTGGCSCGRQVMQLDNTISLGGNLFYTLANIPQAAPSTTRTDAGYLDAVKIGWADRWKWEYREAAR